MRTVGGQVSDAEGVLSWSRIQYSEGSLRDSWKYLVEDLG